MDSKWSNKKPTEDGHYWWVIKIWEDGKLKQITEPVLCFYDIKDGDMMLIGDDCPSGLPDEDIMIHERRQPRDIIFMFDDADVKKSKSMDTVIVKEEHWMMKIEDPKFLEEEDVFDQIMKEITAGMVLHPSCDEDSAFNNSSLKSIRLVKQYKEGRGIFQQCNKQK